MLYRCGLPGNSKRLLRDLAVKTKGDDTPSLCVGDALGCASELPCGKIVLCDWTTPAHWRLHSVMRMQTAAAVVPLRMIGCSRT